MPETTKEKNSEDEKLCEKPHKKDEKNEGAWSKDQREKGYYYDDNHGYEIYNPDEEEDDDED